MIYTITPWIALIVALAWASFVTWRVRRHEEVLAILLEDLTVAGLTHEALQNKAQP